MPLLLMVSFQVLPDGYGHALTVLPYVPCSMLTSRHALNIFCQQIIPYKEIPEPSP